MMPEIPWYTSIHPTF